MTRIDINPEEAGRNPFYALLTSVVVPRPIAWVSSTSPEGVDNLAPHSFFTVASVSPPIIAFTSVGRHDSLRNIEDTGEFVVCLAPEGLFEEINATGTRFPRTVSEFDAVGLTPEPSLTVHPPRVRQSPVALECRLHQALPMGDCTMVFGRVSHAAVAAEVMDGAHPRIDALRPLARLGANEWATIGEVREISRIRVDDWPRDFVRKDRA